jgi:3-hydroxybutyryl-CoA dehydrogenase
VAARKISKMAEIGVGTMGSTVAWACAINGLEVYLYDRSRQIIDSAAARLRNWFSDGNMSQQQEQEAIGRIHPCYDLHEALASVDLAFESVYEDLEVKKEVLAEIGRIAPPRVWIGSNTSSFLCTPLAKASGRPDRFFCMNWSDPRHNEKLVMLMWNAETSLETKQAAVEWARTVKMVPVITRKDIMGYSFNRIWRAVKKESLYVAEIGASNPEDIDRAWMLLFGTDQGPFGLMDQIGLDTVRAIEMRYYEASGDERDKPPAILDNLIAAGNLGVKTGKGFYTYPNPAYQQPGWLYKEPPWSGKDEL